MSDHRKSFILVTLVLRIVRISQFHQTLLLEVRRKEESQSAEDRSNNIITNCLK